MITVTKEDISKVMKKAAKIATGRSMMPIYNHLALKFDGHYLTITASDGTRTYVDKFAASGDPAEFTLEAVKFARAINGMKSGQIEITSKEIKQGRTSIKLESMPYDSFPVPDFEKAQPCGMTSSELFSVCSQIQHALPVKDVRIMLRGVHLTNGFAVATDGLRMAYLECNYEGQDVIIPAETVRTFPEIDGEVSVSANQIIITGQNSIFASSLVDAKYADWKRILPKTFDIELKAEKQDLIDAIKTAEIGGEMIKFTIDPEKAVLSNAGAETVCDVVATGNIEVGFMAQFLTDALNNCIENEITIKLGAGKACLINDNFIVMPVKL